MKEKPKKTKTSMSFDTNILEQIREIAKEDNRNLSNFTENLYKDVISNYKKK